MPPSAAKRAFSMGIALAGAVATAGALAAIPERATSIALDVTLDLAEATDIDGPINGDEHLFRVFDAPLDQSVEVQAGDTVALEVSFADDQALEVFGDDDVLGTGYEEIFFARIDASDTENTTEVEHVAYTASATFLGVEGDLLVPSFTDEVDRVLDPPSATPFLQAENRRADEPDLVNGTFRFDGFSVVFDPIETLDTPEGDPVTITYDAMSFGLTSQEVSVLGIPEPSTGLLLAGGVVGLALRGAAPTRRG